MLPLSVKGIVNRKSAWKLDLVLMTLFILGIASACTTVHPKEDYQLAVIEKQVSELEDKIDEIYHRVSVIQFMVDNHERTLKDLEKSLPAAHPLPKADLPVPPPGDDTIPLLSPAPPASLSDAPSADNTTAPPMPPVQQPPQPAQEDLSESPQILYNKALALYKKGDYTSAMVAFKRFIVKFPQHELADNALYWSGECQYSLKNFSGAVDTFQKVITQYPHGSKVPDAMLKIGYAYLSLNDRENAKTYLKKVVENYPFSPAGTKAEMMLKRIQ